MAGSNLPEVSSFPVNITGPDANDFVTGASVRVMGVGLADRTQFLNDKLRESGGVHVFPFTSAGNTSGVTWQWRNNAWTQADVTTSGTDKVLAPVYLPNGCTVTSITVTVEGGGHSAAPASKPSLDFHKYTSAGFTTISSGATDPTTYPTYDTVHSWSITGLSEVINNVTGGYVVALTGESGANSVDLGLRAFCVAVHFTPAT